MCNKCSWWQQQDGMDKIRRCHHRHHRPVSSNVFSDCSDSSSSNNLKSIYDPLCYVSQRMIVYSSGAHKHPIIVILIVRNKSRRSQISTLSGLNRIWFSCTLLFCRAVIAPSFFSFYFSVCYLIVLYVHCTILEIVFMQKVNFQARKRLLHKHNISVRR